MRRDTVHVPGMTAEQAGRILRDPSTRRLVKEIVALAANRDPVDAIHDVETALAILKSNAMPLIRIGGGS